MRISKTRQILALSLVAISALAPVSMASADNTWINRTSLGSVSLVAPTSMRTGNNTSLSTQISTFALTYKGSPSDAGKFAQINIFNLSSGLTVSLASSPHASASGCDQQVLGSDSHSCMFSLDGSGNAAITVTISGVTLSSSFKYILLSGPNMTQTDPALVSFAAPKSTIKAVASSVKALAGGAALLRFKITENNAAVSGMKADITKTGIGENLSSTSATSDAQGIIYVYLSDLSAKKGNSVITVSIQGTVIKTTGTVVWLTGKLNG
jgi:hypothetical protein